MRCRIPLAVMDSQSRRVRPLSRRQAAWATASTEAQAQQLGTGTKAFVGGSGSLAPWFLHMPGIPPRRASIAMARTDGEGCWDLPPQHSPSASSVSGVRRAMDTPGPLPDGAPYLLDPTRRRSTCSATAPR